MRYRITLGLVAVAVATGGCTSSGTSPATAPPTTHRVSSTSSTDAPTTPPTTVATTTTLDRVAQIQAIFQDLEQRRLAAIRDQDEVAFRSLYANDMYLEQSMMAFESVAVTEPDAFRTLSFEILTETDSCVAAFVRRDYTNALPSGSTTERVIVLERAAEIWGFSWIGEGWSCEGRHPLDSR